MTVAALYVDPRGPYPKLLGPDLCWDESRDAKLYDGPWPVVAHPPCGGWGNLRQMPVPNRERRRHEMDCGPRAVEQVRQFGGVLEQPAGSKLWEHCGLPSPSDATDAYGGRTFEVSQCDWGHVARKKTWLYVVGGNQRAISAAIRRRAGTGTPTHWVSGGRVSSRKGGRRGGGIVPVGIKVCSAQQRWRTPLVFAKWLISLAESANERWACA